jgi:hypothetical protein
MRFTLIFACAMRGSLCLLSLLGCSDESPESGAPGKRELGEACYSHEDCLTQRCLLSWDHLPETNRCTRSCENESCPDGYRCGTSTDGSRLCVFDSRSLCGSDQYHVYACLGDGNEPIACEQAPDNACYSCGCLEGLRCVSSEETAHPMCIEPLGIGEACWGGDWCESGNCSGTHYEEGACFSPVGGECTDETCQHCLSGEAWSFCTIECESESSCPDDYGCASSSVGSSYLCWKKCHPDGGAPCPGALECLPVESGDHPGVIAYYACL